MSIGDRILAVAAGELGMTEFPAGSNNVKYNTWYYGREVSGAAYPWCMAFVQWCCAEAGYPLPYKTASCSALLNWYRANEPGRIVNTPEKGDIVIYGFGHTGIVESAGDGTVTAIEGNTSTGSGHNGGGVMRRVRSEGLVKAYIRPFGEEKMTGKEILEKLCEYLNQMPVPGWAQKEYEEAVKAGITDGTDPMGLVPRYQAAVMALRAGNKGKNGDKGETVKDPQRKELHGADGKEG